MKRTVKKLDELHQLSRQELFELHRHYESVVYFYQEELFLSISTTGH